MAIWNKEQRSQEQAGQMDNLASSFQSLLRTESMVRQSLSGFDNAEQITQMLTTRLSKEWGFASVNQGKWEPDAQVLEDLAGFVESSVLGGKALNLEDRVHPVSTFSINLSGGNLDEPHDSEVVLWANKEGRKEPEYILLARKQGGVQRISG